MKVPFGDLARQYAALAPELDAAAREVLASGWYVLGRQVQAFEDEYAQWIGCRNTVGCASGTEAITLALMAAGIGAGDTVITAANSCVPTATGIVTTGATIAFCDVDPSTALMDPAALANILARTRARAVIPVHLYGHPADVATIIRIAQEYDAIVIDDAAQGHGAQDDAGKVGTHGTFATCWSFYPSKNLGACGDAGALTTDDDERAETFRQLRNYGQRVRYYHDTPGLNSRLDEMQAALLRAKLPHLDAWTTRRREIVARYKAEITNPVIVPISPRPGTHSACHLAAVRCDARDELQEFLTSRGVQTLIHYPVPIPAQKAFAHLNTPPEDYRVAASLAARELSLPLFPELTDDEVTQVITACNAFVPSN